MEGVTTWKTDLAVVGVVAAITTTIRQNAHKYFERTMPEWLKLKEDIRSRLAVEVAVIPSRIVLFYLTLPLMLGGFSPMDSWTADDTARSLLSCAILTGAYIVDLTVTRTDKFATLHHVMGPALLLWIRTCFSSFTSSDALLCRLLIQFVFFGATISGATTTTLVFLYQFRKTWFQSAEGNAYLYFTTLLPVLTLTTMISTFYCTIYIHAWFDELLNYFGHPWGYAPLAWVMLECGMQWKWLLWFYGFEEWYRATTAEDPTVPEDAKKRITDVAAGAWWLPRWRFAAIKALVVVWLGTWVGIVHKAGDIQWVVNKAGELVMAAWGEGVNLRVGNQSGVEAHVEL
ncbi:hypothetical protein B0H63DRAFT_478485 [Podospora didyma]|uniref:Uncharacterized protein n=1 Tax=Podospora didyma TaxID=330526 RepID=A0AAE0KKP0_9PEZI|nr:hypothetical protein B0H63DRAFT_478485 [Podospora didyma]